MSKLEKVKDGNCVKLRRVLGWGEGVEVVFFPKTTTSMYGAKKSLGTLTLFQVVTPFQNC